MTSGRKKTKARGKSQAARRGSRPKTASTVRKKAGGKAAPRKAAAKRSARAKAAPRKAAAKRSAGAKASPRKAAVTRSAGAKASPRKAAAKRPAGTKTAPQAGARPRARAKDAPKVPARPSGRARPTAGQTAAAAPNTAANPANRAARRRTARARSKTPPAPLPKPPTPAGVEPRSKLGEKYSCFECGAKFYDLNRPEPLCPKCGADQRNRPAREVKLKTSRTGGRRPARRAMAPLLVEDEDEAVVEEEVVMDLEIAVVDSPEAVADDEDSEDEGTE